MKGRKDSAYFVNFNTIKYDNVFITQVLNWLQIYEKNGLFFDLVMFKSIKDLIFRQGQKDDVKEIRRVLKARVIPLYLYNPNRFLGQYVAFFLFFLVIWTKIITGKAVVIQMRSPQWYRALKLLKRIGRKIKVIYDSRAAGADEMRYFYEKDNSLSRYRHVVREIEKSEIEMARISDLVFCVSRKLKAYHLSQDPDLDASKFRVYPNSADPTGFYYSGELREACRRELSIEKRKVLVYSGGIEAPWHLAPEIFRLFSLLHRLDRRYFLLLLTREIETARLYISRQKMDEGDVRVISVHNTEVCKYLNAADCGLQLRASGILSEVSSPTKFSEYLLTGLPVMISEGVGDFSAFVRHHRVGCVLPHQYSRRNLIEIDNFLNSMISGRLFSRQEIADLGKAHFSKEIYLPLRLAEFYRLAGAADGQQGEGA
jgi:hypothetical protein